MEVDIEIAEAILYCPVGWFGLATVYYCCVVGECKGENTLPFVLRAKGDDLGDKEAHCGGERGDSLCCSRCRYCLVRWWGP